MFSFIVNHRVVNLNCRLFRLRVLPILSLPEVATYRTATLFHSTTVFSISIRVNIDVVAKFSTLPLGARASCKLLQEEAGSDVPFICIFSSCSVAAASALSSSSSSPFSAFLQSFAFSSATLLLLLLLCHCQQKNSSAP